VGIWLAIGSGMLTLLLAAMGKQKRDTCKGYDIVIKNADPGNFFLAKDDIAILLKASAKGNIKGQSKSGFNLLQMEASLEKNVWIKDAQLYFDNNGMLHVSVMEREPVARIFTPGGKSFYIDEGISIMPLSERAIAKVPVFTGFPDKKKWEKADSVLAGNIKTTAQFISSNSFWRSQVAQINIIADCGAGCWQFEMTPVIGNHFVRLGTEEEMEKKFKRLFIFYQQVSAQNGFDKYKTIDVRFSGQVVAEKNDNYRADSAQHAKRIESLMRGMNNEQLTMGNE
jgi:cell division protein FtsQ